MIIVDCSCKNFETVSDHIREMIVGLQKGGVSAVVFLDFGIFGEEAGFAGFIFFTSVSGFLVIFSVFFLRQENPLNNSSIG